MPCSQLNLERFAFCEILEPGREFGERERMADGRHNIDHSILQPGNRRLKSMAQGKAANDRPVIFENSVRLEIDMRIDWCDAELQKLPARFEMVECQLDHRWDTRRIDHDRKTVWRDVFERAR